MAMSMYEVEIQQESQLKLMKNVYPVFILINNKKYYIQEAMMEKLLHGN